MSTMNPLRLDNTVCDRCGRCEPLCKPKALRVGPGYILVDWDRCTACGKCAAACDRGAIVAREGAVAAAISDGGLVATVAKVPSVKPVAKAGAPTKSVAAAPPARPPVPLSSASAVAGPASGVAWSLPEAALALAAAFVPLAGAQVLLPGVTGSPVWGGVALAVYDLLLAFLLLLLARRHGEGPLAALRLDVAPEFHSWMLALPVALGCWLFSVIYRATALSFGFAPPVSEGGADLTALFGPGVVGIVLTVTVVAVVGPLLEEALLRGVVLTSLRRRFGEWIGIVVGALAFALLHASLWSLLPLTVLGVGLGWLAARSRSLWPAVIAHVLYNGVLVGAALYAAAR